MNDNEITAGCIRGVESGALTSATATGPGFKFSVTSSPKRRYGIGDTRIMGKKKAVWIKQQQMTYECPHVMTVSRRGKPCTEWVRKGSERDQTSENYRPWWQGRHENYLRCCAESGIWP